MRPNTPVIDLTQYSRVFTDALALFPPNHQRTLDNITDSNSYTDQQARSLWLAEAHIDSLTEAATYLPGGEANRIQNVGYAILRRAKVLSSTQPQPDGASFRMPDLQQTGTKLISLGNNRYDLPTKATTLAEMLEAEGHTASQVNAAGIFYASITGQPVAIIVDEKLPNDERVGEIIRKAGIRREANIDVYEGNQLQNPSKATYTSSD